MLLIKIRFCPKNGVNLNQDYARLNKTLVRLLERYVSLCESLLVERANSLRRGGVTAKQPTSDKKQAKASNGANLGFEQKL
jgi:hypothetical protein